MSITIDHLTLTPQPINKGKTAVTLSYVGFVTKASDNDVNFTLKISPDDTNIFLIDDDGSRVNIYSFKQNLQTHAPEATLNKTVTFEVLNTPDDPTICLVKLIGETADNSDTDIASSAITYS